MQKIRNKQTEAYFRKFTQALQVKQGQLTVSEFPLRIVFLDSIITHFPKQISDLCLNSTFLTAPECLVLAGNESLTRLKSLDLSCNPLTALGLINLVHPRRSCFQNLLHLTLFNCEIDFS